MGTIALYTFGLLDTAVGSDRLADFVRRGTEILGDVDHAPGYLGRPAKPTGEPETHTPGEDYGAWGRYALPRIREFGDHDPQAHIATLSHWLDLDSAREFVYHGGHREALRRRRDWFFSGPWPGYVLWEVGGGAVPRWSEGVERYEALAREGESPERFSFAGRRAHA